MVADELFGHLPRDWRYTTLGAACEEGGGDIQTGPFGSQLHASDYVLDGVPSIMPQNIGDNRIIEEGIARVSLGDAERLSRYLVRKGDIVYSRRGDVEKRALVREHEDGWLCGTGCLRVRFGQGDVDPRYASFYLGHPIVREWIVRHAHGATMPNLNTSILSRCPFVIPPAADQSAFANILSAFDDRIELNRRINETLEAMTRALFKSWFVDFDPVRCKAERQDIALPRHIADLFPDALEQTESGEIPKGWRLSPVYGIAAFINGAAYRDFEPNQQRKGLPIIKIAELKNGVTAQTAFSDAEMPEKYRIDKRDILFSWSGNPDTSIDTFVWARGPGWLNQHIFRVIPPNEEARAFVLMTLRDLRPVFAEIARNKQTTGLGHVTAADLKRLRVAYPPKSVLREWNRIVEPLLERSFLLQLECCTLTSVRDVLLPKILSGELQIDNPDRFIAGHT